MSRSRTPLLALPISALLIAAAFAQPTPSQPGLLFDPAQLPAFHGKVAQYSLTPRGGVDGLIFDDGLQVNLNRRLSTQLAAIVKPGDTVTVHGVKTTSGSLILALSVTNDAGGQTLVSEPYGRRGGRASIVAQGKIKALLHNREDEVDGVLLEDGSQIRLWPGEARRMAGQLTPGQTIYASGFGQDGLLGKVVVPRRIGVTEADAADLQPPMMGFGMPWFGRRRMDGRDGSRQGPPPRGDRRAPAAPPGPPDAPAAQ